MRDYISNTKKHAFLVGVLQASKVFKIQYFNFISSLRKNTRTTGQVILSPFTDFFFYNYREDIAALSWNKLRIRVKF